MYNVAKPISYHNNGLKNLSDIPQINFKVNKNGNLFKQNLNIDLKENAVDETIDNKHISRIKVKIFAEKLGTMSITFDNVVLNNNSYCYVYTPDYKIVAGPIYQKSILEYLIISSIPTDELIIEVVSNETEEFNLTLKEVSYNTISNNKQNPKKSNNDYILNNDSCHTCSDGVKDYIDFVNSPAECGWLGYDNEYSELFNFEGFNGINEFQYNASRSTCVVLTQNCENSSISLGNNATLIHFPYHNCDNSFVISVAHHGQFAEIRDAQEANNQDFLNKILIRFNWQHKYGTPWNLKGLNCEANQANFELWRTSIDFDEVIDYCGVNVFAFAPGGDFIILKIKQKLFYKEHHLGWTEQRYFNQIFGEMIDTNRYSIIGRRSIRPAFFIKNYAASYFGRYIAQDSNNSIQLFVVKKDKTNENDKIPLDFNFDGFSGSLLTYSDYNDSNQRIALGLVNSGAPGDYEATLRGRDFYSTFNFWDDVTFYENSYSQYNNIMNFMKSEFPNLLQTKNYPYSIISRLVYNNYDTLSGDTTCYWMPSVDNKQKCPSQIYSSDSCKFDIINYINWNDSTYCLSLDSIPQNQFPGNQYPKGYRIYYNDANQKTIFFESYNDNLPIQFNFSHCFSSCELFDLFMKGKDSLDIAIDFYDSEGRILNQKNCEKIVFKTKLNFDLCSMIEIDAQKIETYPDSCVYKFHITIKDSCAKNKPFLRKLASTIKLLKSIYSTGIYLKDIPDIAYNYSQGQISFCRSITQNNSNDKFIFAYEDGQIVCNSPEVTAEGCSCQCPDAEISKDWINVTISSGGPGSECPENTCQVTYDISIPPYYNCFKYITMNSNHIEQLSNNGKLSYTFCIPTGSTKIDTILFKRKNNDTMPCSVVKYLFCPIISEPIFCKTGCDSVEWKERTIENLPLPDCPDCMVNAKYVSRKNICEDKQELQVTEFEINNTNGDSLACAACVDNMEEIHKLIIQKAIHNNAMGFKPKSEEVKDSLCDITWRVSISSCWTKYHTGIEFFNGDTIHKNKTKYYPCDTLCCSIGLRVCRYKGPPQYVRIDTLEGSMMDQNLCNKDSLFIFSPYISGEGNEQIYVTGYYSPCINRCNALNILSSGPYYGKRAIPNIPTNNILVANECRLLTYINEETMNCIFDSDVNTNNFSISIFSINGVLLLKENKKIVKGYNEFSLDLKKINTGIYIIQAELDGVCSKTDKLIIVK